ncbi:unnamed protein product [Ectocarpus sp. 12 AP-2014]
MFDIVFLPRKRVVVCLSAMCKRGRPRAHHRLAQNDRRVAPYRTERTRKSYNHCCQLHTRARKPAAVAVVEHRLPKACTFDSGGEEMFTTPGGKERNQRNNRP